MAGANDLTAVRAAVRAVHVAGDVARYIVALTRATRETPLLRLGASPRASLALQHAAQATAALAGRDFVTPDDVQALVEPVLAHRLLLARDAAIDGRSGADVLREVVDGRAGAGRRRRGRRRPGCRRRRRRPRGR